MTASRKFNKWTALPEELQFYIGTFSGFQDTLSLMQTSKTTLALMKHPMAWLALLKRYFPFDAACLQKQSKINFFQEFKKFHIRDNHTRSRAEATDELLPLRERKLLTLFKEGRLNEIKKQNPAVTLAEILILGDSQSYSLAQWAAFNGHQDILDYYYREAIKQYPAADNINGCLGFKNSPRIFWAACFNQQAELNHLLETKGIDVNKANDKGQTALHAAACMGHYPIVAQLLLANASPDISDWFNKTPCWLAASIGNLQILKILLQSQQIDRPDCTLLMAAARHGHNETVVELLQSKAEVNGRTEYGENALKFASEHGHAETVKILLQANAQVNGTNAFGNAPWEALHHNHCDVLALLIEAKAEVNRIDHYKETLLFIAARRGLIEAAEMLVANKANVDFRNQQGYAPLAIAAFHEHTSVVNCLLKAGATWHYDERDRNWIFNSETKTKPEIKKLLLNAELGKHVSEVKEINSHSYRTPR